MAYVTNNYDDLIETRLNNPEGHTTNPTSEVYDKVLTYAELDHLMGRLNDIGKVLFDKEGKNHIFVTHVCITKLDKDKYVIQLWGANELISGACIYCNDSKGRDGDFPILASVKNTVDEESAVLVNIRDWKYIKNLKSKYLTHKTIIDLME